MKYISLWDMDKYDFLLKNILAVALKPKRRAINHTSRPLNSFTLFTQGEVEYTFDGEKPVTRTETDLANNTKTTVKYNDGRVYDYD